MSETTKKLSERMRDTAENWSRVVTPDHGLARGYAGAAVAEMARQVERLEMDLEEAKKVQPLGSQIETIMIAIPGDVQTALTKQGREGWRPWGVLGKDPANALIVGFWRPMPKIVVAPAGSIITAPIPGSRS